MRSLLDRRSIKSITKSCKNKTASADIVAESVDLQGVQLEELAGMISSARSAVDEIAAQCMLMKGGMTTWSSTAVATV